MRSSRYSVPVAWVKFTKQGTPSSDAQLPSRSFKGSFLPATSSFLCLSTPRLTDEYLTHDPRCPGEKVSPAFPVPVLLTLEAEVGLVNESRGIEGVPFSLPRQKSRRHPPEFRIQLRHEFVESPRFRRSWRLPRWRSFSAICWSQRNTSRKSRNS